MRFSMNKVSRFVNVRLEEGSSKKTSLCGVERIFLGQA